MYQIIPSPTTRNEWKIVTIEIDNVKKSIQLRFRFLDTLGLWHISIYDPNTGGCLAESIPLLRGLYPSADLLGPFPHLGLGSAFIIPLVAVPTSENPTDTNLGTEFALVWGDRVD